MRIQQQQICQIEGIIELLDLYKYHLREAQDISPNIGNIHIGTGNFT